ncbi:MAG: dihydrolipoyl dehydrogenase [Phycisphaerae bacterium]|nr:dihydrolipoyl dehydrogenase [Phycisphaerae bacterium]
MGTDTEYDVVVIGAGPGGYVAALRASQLGLHTAVVEKCNTFGGTCLNVGCIPSKALLESSHRYAEIRQGAGRHGIVVGDVRLDLAVMMGRKDKIVNTLTAGVAALLKANQVRTFQGGGTLHSPGEVAVEVDGGTVEVLRSQHTVIATGSIPASLDSLPLDHELIVDSTDALSFEAVPQKLVVVGGGAVGLELASVWARLGATVTVVELMDQLLPGFDKQISRLLERVLSKQGVKVLTSSSVESCERANGRGQVKVKIPDNSTVELAADKVLVAAGRRPNTSGLGLEQIGVATDVKSGRVPVGERFMTNIAGIYAIGDVIGDPMLAHKAEAEGIAVAEIIAGKPGQVNYDAIAGVVYTWPEVAVVGKTEDQLLKAQIEYDTGVFHFRANGRAMAADNSDGFVKILAEKSTDRVMGVHMIGPGVSELIAEVVAVVEFGGSAEDIARTVHAHPTLSEVVQEAALAVGNRSIHSVPKKG